MDAAEASGWTRAAARRPRCACDTGGVWVYQEGSWLRRTQTIAVDRRGLMRSTSAEHGGQLNGEWY